MPSPHTLTRRVLPLLGLALFVPVALAAALWWMAFHHPDWIAKLPDTKSRLIQRGMDRLYQMRLSWPSKDANENGIPDWYEVSGGYDPRASRFFDGFVYAHNPYIYLEERTPLHLMCDISDRYRDIRWPIDTEVLITATAPILLSRDAPDGTPPTAGPLRVKLSNRGRLEFDAIMLKPQTAYIGVSHARSGQILATTPQVSSAKIRAEGWRLPVWPSRVELRMVRDLIADITNSRGFKDVEQLQPFLVWEPHPDRQVVLEAARVDAPDEWVRFDSKDIPGMDRSDHQLGKDDREMFPNYTGSLLYRVIPIALRQRPE